MPSPVYIDFVARGMPQFSAAMKSVQDTLVKFEQQGSRASATESKKRVSSAQAEAREKIRAMRLADSETRKALAAGAREADKAARAGVTAVQKAEREKQRAAEQVFGELVPGIGSTTGERANVPSRPSQSMRPARRDGMKSSSAGVPAIVGRKGFAAVACVVALTTIGCRRTDDGARRAVADPGADAGAPSAEPHAEARPVEAARVERIRVPGDVVASVVRSSGGAAPTTVFLPGLCSNAQAYLQAFPEAARRQGGVVAVEGDQPCGNLAGFRSFSWDAARLHARIEAATAAAGLAAVPREGLTLVGYSQGAALGEQLVQRWPGRYARIVLIGAPTDPSAVRFAEARAVVTISCSRDVPGKMKEATNRFVKAGIPSTYLEMPDCTHGNITDGDRTFDAAFDWLRTNARPPKPDATPQPIVGDG